MYPDRKKARDKDRWRDVLLLMKEYLPVSHPLGALFINTTTTLTKCIVRSLSSF